MTDEQPKRRAARDTIRIDIAATIVAGIAAQGAGRIRDDDMVDTALRLADLLIARAK